ncbi:MAG: transposase [Gammaproteobacteria bacterium]|nr:MAG: transposase [Gammaproteobacteria bacterium]
MKDIGNFSKIFLAIKPVDFRKQIYGLAAIAKDTLEEQTSESRSLFIFTNRNKSAIRILYWDLTGFALWTKILEKDRFKWPRRSEEAKRLISQRELKWLLQGIDIEKIKVHEPLKTSGVI